MVINGAVALIIIIYILLGYKLIFKPDNGIRLRRNDEKYIEVYQLVDRYCGEIGLRPKIHLHIWLNVQDPWQAAAKRNYIILSKVLLDNYMADEEKYHLIFRFLLLHELMHIKNQDMGFDLSGLLKGIDYLRAIRCLKEARADIQAVNFAKLNDEQIDNVFEFLICDVEEGYCNPYRYGYPRKAKRKNYVLKYQTFTEEAAIEVWEDFQQGLVIENRKVNFQVVAERLFRQVNYN